MPTQNFFWHPAGEVEIDHLLGQVDVRDAQQLRARPVHLLGRQGAHLNQISAEPLAPASGRERLPELLG